MCRVVGFCHITFAEEDDDGDGFAVIRGVSVSHVQFTALILHSTPSLLLLLLGLFATFISFCCNIAQLQLGIEIGPINAAFVLSETESGCVCNCLTGFTSLPPYPPLPIPLFSFRSSLFGGQIS